MGEIKSWIDKTVRIQEEFIVKVDFDGNALTEDEIYIDEPVLNSFVRNPRGIFKVTADVYGVDLYSFRDKALDAETATRPNHLIVIEAIDCYENEMPNIPIFWNSWYFEPVKLAPATYIPDED